jgi:hypothetical protein
VVLRGSVSIKVGLREVKLVRRGVARPMTAQEERVNRRVALELAGAADWFEARDGADLIELLGSNASEEHPRAPSARSERMVIERVRDDLERALRRGEVMAEERPAPPPPTLQAEPPPELPPPPLPRPRPEPETAASEPDLPPERVDQEFQAQTLRAAADQGAPFCEECAKARRGKDGPSPATHPAPEPPSGPL